MKLSDLNLLSIGHAIQMTGMVFQGEGKVLLCLFPENSGSIFSGQGRVFFNPGDKSVGDPGYEEQDVHVLDMTKEEWMTFIRQTDLLETEVLTKASDGTLAKIVLRKSQRQLDTVVQWNVWRRDNFRCQYCYGELPLTVDHLIPWEQQGASVEANLLSSCKKDNRIRGNLSFEEWLKHPRYLEVSKNLPPDVRARNEALVATLDRIPRMTHTRSR